MKYRSGARRIAPAALAAWIAAAGGGLLLARQAPRTDETPHPAGAPASRPAPAPARRRAIAPAARRPRASPMPPIPAPTARTPRSHLYGLNQERIYKGRLPPLLYAIGVLQVEVDGRGNVRDLNWMRAPRHAPEVVAEIERTVRAAAPFPAPARMGKVVYTDTWLWHKSGRFQLDTLTEGQD